MLTVDEKVDAIIDAIESAIRELGEIPSGHLYARLMGIMTLDTYNKLLNLFEQQGKIKVRNHLITWTGN